MRTLTGDRVAALGQSLCQRIGEPRYDLWFKNKTKFTLEDNRLVVGVPNLFYQEWLHKTFAEEVRHVALTVLGEQLDVDFLIDPAAGHKVVLTDNASGLSSLPRHVGQTALLTNWETRFFTDALLVLAKVSRT